MSVKEILKDSVKEYMTGGGQTDYEDRTFERIYNIVDFEIMINVIKHYIKVGKSDDGIDFMLSGLVLLKDLRCEIEYTHMMVMTQCCKVYAEVYLDDVLEEIEDVEEHVALELPEEEHSLEFTEESN